MNTDNHTIIIAEIGENHLGNMDMAKVMIDQVAEAGADIVKFQSYRGADVRDDDPERDWFCKVELSDEMHHELKAHAEGQGVEFMSSPFTVERARLLCEGLGLKKIKIASSEMTNHRMLDYVNDHAEVVFLSTGMANIEEVDESLKHLNKVTDVYILHCVTEYPCEDADANLLAIDALKKAFPDYKIGFSDHTLGVIAPLAAVALGAQVIEKHYTIARTLPGTDHVLSVNPDEFRQLVKDIRRLELMLGSPEKTPAPAEMEIRDLVRTRWAKD
ncbi:MAG: N-acetylneuraminate synthase family protein [Chloroflexi bacterium]|nr:N-acetylneuraminate synthase family protein [Chloroflexota bacterium]